MRYRGLLFLLLCTLPFSALAWSFEGHVLIGQIAYDNLTVPAKQKAQELAVLIWQQLSVKMQEKLNRQFPDSTTFAKIAMLPDTWRKWHLRTIFQHFDAPLPLNLLFYSNSNTSTWHYINQPYPNDAHCQTIQGQNVAWAIPLLEQDFLREKNPQEQTVLMVLLEHFVGDSTQPLHDLSHVNSNCQEDAGGNAFCLKFNATGGCTKNLIVCGITQWAFSSRIALLNRWLID
jgi:hypothetical protein